MVPSFKKKSLSMKNVSDGFKKITGNKYSSFLCSFSNDVNEDSPIVTFTMRKFYSNKF